MTASGTTVLLPVAAPGAVLPLAIVAVGLAGVDGRIVAISAVPAAAPAALADARRTLATVEDAVHGTGVAVDSFAVAAESVTAAIHQATVDHGADVVVMGWRGSGNAATAFGSIVDQVVGRSRVPLVMVRPGERLPSALLLAFDTDQLHPSGRRGLVLAATVAASLRERHQWPLTLLQTGVDESPELPVEVATLTDRIHHDPRRRHEALAAVAQPSHLVVAPVAPTMAGLRSATSRINWAADGATLAVAVDVGPVGPRESLVGAAEDHGTPRGSMDRPRPRRHGIAVTATAPEPVDRRSLQRALSEVGEVSGIRTWWAHADAEPHLSLVVTVVAESDSEAIGRVLGVLDTLPALAGARVRYDLVDPPTPLRVRELTPLGLVDPRE